MPTSSSPLVSSISDRAHALLREGPHTPDELVDVLRAEGHDLGADPHDLLFEVLADDNVPMGERWVNLPSALHGSRWFVRSSGEVLELDRGAEVITAWHWDELPLLDADGASQGAVVHELSDTGVCLRGPAGWLAGLGQAVELEFRREGLLVRSAGDLPTVPAAVGAALHAAFEAEVEVLDDPFDGHQDDDPLCLAEAHEALLRAFVDHGDTMRSTVLAPIDHLAAAAGLELDGDHLAPAGIDWTAVRAARRFHELHAHHGLSADDTTAVLMLLGACSAVVSGAADALGDDDADRQSNAFVLSMALNSGDVCRVFVHEAVERGTSPDDVIRFADALLDVIGDGPGNSGPEVVRAACLDLLERTDDTIAALERAVRHDPHPLAHATLAGFAADRGDAAEAARLLRGVGIEPRHRGMGGAVWAEIEPFLRRPRVDVGRNDPCPCGSGRKYKACHLGSEVHPLRDRAAWLYRKASRYVGEHAAREQGDLAMTFVDAAGGDAQLLGDVIDSPLVNDLVLDELGVMRHFIDRRRTLLPHDERELAALWLLVDRSVHHVDATGPDWLELTDLASDDTVRITGVRGDRVRAGSHVVARLLPVGDQLVSWFGYLPVPDPMLDEVVAALDDGDAFDIAAVLGACFVPR